MVVTSTYGYTDGLRHHSRYTADDYRFTHTSPIGRSGAQRNGVQPEQTYTQHYIFTYQQYTNEAVRGTSKQTLYTVYSVHMYDVLYVLAGLLLQTRSFFIQDSNLERFW